MSHRNYYHRFGFVGRTAGQGRRFNSNIELAEDSGGDPGTFRRWWSAALGAPYRPHGGGAYTNAHQWRIAYQEYLAADIGGGVPDPLKGSEAALTEWDCMHERSSN